MAVEPESLAAAFRASGLCWSEVYQPPDPSALPGMHEILDPDPELAAPRPANGKLVARPVLNGLHHDYRCAA